MQRAEAIEIDEVPPRGERTPRNIWFKIPPTGLWLIIAVALSSGLAASHSPLAPLPGVATLLLIPGATVMAFLGARPANTAGRLVLAVCLSMTVIMVVGGVVSLIGPHLGLAHPLGTLPESVIWFLLALLVLRIGAAKRCDPVVWIFDGVRVRDIYIVLFCGVLVVPSILGAAQLNHSGNARLAEIATVLDVAVLIASAEADGADPAAGP